MWQWYAPELWRRFTIALRRQLARHLGVTETLCRGLVRVQFAKVAEVQRRGVVHFHALIRLDGPPIDEQRYPPPAVELEASALADLVVQAVRLVSCDPAAVDGIDRVRRLRFGRQVDVRVVHDQADRDHPAGAALHPETVAAYVAKYATKAAADLGSADRAASPHLRRLRTVVGELAVRATLAARTGPEGAFKGWSRWADMLGFRAISRPSRGGTPPPSAGSGRHGVITSGVRSGNVCSGRRSGPTTTRTTSSWSPPRWSSGRGDLPGSAG